MTDEEVEFRPPTAQQVARRALVLCAVVCRGSIDGGAGNPDAEKLPARIRAWLERARLVDHLEPWEADIVKADLGGMLEHEVYRATWAVEGLAVLAWALGCSQFPRHDQQVDPYTVAESLGFLGEDSDDFIATARLQSAEELHACRELMYAVHCRLRQFLRNNDRKEFSDWVEEEWLEVLQLDPSDVIAEGDLAINAVPVSAVALDVVRGCEWAVCEQHRASIWLIGEEHPHYWDWGVDT